MSEMKCGNESCLYHVLTDSVIHDLKEAVKRIMEGQDQMKETVIQLAEAFKSMERLDRKIDKIEELQRSKNESTDRELSSLKGTLYKAGGAVAALMVLGEVAIRIIIGA